VAHLTWFTLIHFFLPMDRYFQASSTNKPMMIIVPWSQLTTCALHTALTQKNICPAILGYDYSLMRRAIHTTRLSLI
jgi:hypothetical protein